MHIKQIGNRYLNLDMMTDAYWDGNQLIVTFPAYNGAENTPNVLYLKDKEAAKLIEYLSSQDNSA